MNIPILAILVFFMTISGTFGALFFKKTTAQLSGKSFLSLLGCIWLYLGGGCYLLGAVLNIVLLRYMPYSVLYPMTCLTYIWTMIVSYFAVGEKITRYKVIAIICIVTGVILVVL